MHNNGTPGEGERAFALSREVEIAWAAGLFEGEGCIANHSTNSGQLLLGMTDRDVVDRFARIVGRGTLIVETRPDKPRNKPVYRWRVGSRQDVEYVLCLLSPFFGERRMARSAALVERLRVNRGPGKLRTHCPAGHEYTEENTRWLNARRGRECRTCIRNKQKLRKSAS